MRGAESIEENDAVLCESSAALAKYRLQLWTRGFGSYILDGNSHGSHFGMADLVDPVGKRASLGSSKTQRVSLDGFQVSRLVPAKLVRFDVLQHDSLGWLIGRVDPK